MNFNDKSDRGQSRPDDTTTVSTPRVYAAEGIMPTGTATPRKGDTWDDRRPAEQYPAPMTEQPTSVDEQIEAIYADENLTREQKITQIASLYGITEPVTAPELFARIRGLDRHRPAAT